jgi:hypothetical protein
LIATGTIALLGALVAVVAFTAFQDRHIARSRLLKLLPVLLVGIMVVGLWMHRKPAPLEWSLPGYPASYLNQLKVKNGNYPELGMARWSDIPGRIESNVLEETDHLVTMVLRHGVNQTKLAVVVVPFLLILFGWLFSVWKSGGTDLVAWYFAGYQFIYLLWPWKMEDRFLIPIAPLDCLYLWQGGLAVITAVKTKPRVSGMVWFPVGLLLSISGAHWLYAHWGTGYGDWPDELLIPTWIISAGCALRMAYTGRALKPLEAASKAGQWLRRPVWGQQVSPLHLARYAGYLTVICLVSIGVVSEVGIARANLLSTGLGKNFETTGVSEFLEAEVDAGIWLRSHTAPDAVVMARHWPTVLHYAERKLVWFAPISNPDVLFKGIAQHGVDFVVVVHHANPYYLPDDDHCFDPLLAAHPGSFEIVLERPNLRIFRVERSGDTLRAPHS